MRVVVVLLTLLIVAAGVLPGEADARRRKGKAPRTIIVQDYTSDAGWTPIVERVVAAFSAVMPKNTPRLLYKRMNEPIDCWALSRVKKQHTIRVCSFQAHPNNDSIASADGRNVWLADNRLGRPSAPFWHDRGEGAEFARTFCHEFMHALTGLGDHYEYGYGYFDLPYAETDCFWGWQTTPGPHDIEQIRQAFIGRKRR
ncbi:MAG: hypothetical protein AB7R89_31745 [Dehalococcoidia bacterium]